MCRASNVRPRRASVRFKQDLEIKHMRDNFEVPKIPLTNRSGSSRTSSDDEDSFSDSSNTSPRYLIPLITGENRSKRWYDDKAQMEHRLASDALHAWTSRDLRKYLIRKAHYKLCPPQASFDSDCEDTDLSTSSNELPSVSGRPADTYTTNTTTTTSSFMRENSIANRQSRIVRGFVSSRGIDIYRGNVGYRSCVGPTDTLQLNRIGLGEPRQRLWSLPTVIVTHLDISNSGERRSSFDGWKFDPNASSSLRKVDGDSDMQYLSVPSSSALSPLGSPRLRSSMRRTSSCLELNIFDIEDEKTDDDDLHLASILSLWPSEQSDDYDSESTAAFGVRETSTVLQYENSYVSILQLRGVFSIET